MTAADERIDPEGQVVAFPAGEEFRLAWVAHGDARAMRDTGAPYVGPEHWEVTFMDDLHPLPILVHPDTLTEMRPVPIVQESVLLPENRQHWETMSDTDRGRIVAVPNLGPSGSYRIGVVERTTRDDPHRLYYSIAAVNESWSVRIHKDQADCVVVVPTTLTRAEVESLNSDGTQHRQQRPGLQPEKTEQQVPARGRSIALGL